MKTYLCRLADRAEAAAVSDLPRNCVGDDQIARAAREGLWRSAWLPDWR